MVTGVAHEYAFEMAALSDVGTGRDHNEDYCGVLVDSATCGVAAVADGVSGSEGGETASRMAIEVTLRAWRELPVDLPPAKRLARAVQQANIEVHELSLFVPELRGMATTLTAVALERGEMTIAHVGDSRLYLVREGTAVQLTKDHTVAAERQRIGLLSAEQARTHAGKSVLTRSLGRELICAIDRISMRLSQGEVLVLCSDGLHGVLGEREIEALVRHADAPDACRALIDAANALGTPDNLTAAVVRMTGPIPARPKPPALGDKLRQLVDALRST
jgi:protein phosphatase